MYNDVDQIVLLMVAVFGGVIGFLVLVVLLDGKDDAVGRYPPVRRRPR